MEVNTNLITTICNRLRSIDGTFSSYSDLYDICVRNSTFPHIWSGIMPDNYSLYHIHHSEALLTVLNTSNRLDIYSSLIHSMLLATYWCEVVGTEAQELQRSNKSLERRLGLEFSSLGDLYIAGGVSLGAEYWTRTHSYLRTHLPSYVECLYYWTHSDELTRAMEAQYIHNKVSPHQLNKMGLEAIRARLETSFK